MKFLELVNKRYSVRSYKDKPVDRKIIERCLEAARLAPSASNSQPWYFIVVDDPELKDKIARRTFNRFISFNRFAREAPVLVVVITEKSNLFARVGGMIKGKRYNLIDIGIAVEHFCLQATEEGIGTCILGWFDEEGIKKILKIPKNKSVDLIITMGYPKDKPKKKNRKSLDEIRSYNKYQTKP